MVPTRIRLSALPTIGGVTSGTLAAIAVALLPQAWLEQAVELSGAGLLVAAAQPPLGATARLATAVGGSLFAGATIWAALYLLFGPGGAFARSGGEDGMPEVRLADAHPDAPPRKPLSVADLEEPRPAPLPLPIERDLPRDLNLPLAAFDPAAIPDQPIVPPAPSYRAPLAAGERIESFEISARHAFETGASSIEALLARLENGTQRRQVRLSRAG